MSQLKKSLKWSPAVPIRKPDNIKSSKARERKECGFTPSYVTEKRENMNFIMSNEYMRKWFSERDHYQRELFIRMQVQSEEKHLRRRYVQKMLTREKREKVLPIIQLKRFQNIPSKSDTRRDGDKVKEQGKKDTESKDDKDKFQNEVPVYQRYKPECAPRKKKNAPSKSNEDKITRINDMNVQNTLRSTEGKEQATTDQIEFKMDNKNAMRFGLTMVPCYCKCDCHCNRNGLNGLDPH